MANLGMGMLGGAATGAAGGLTSGLAGGTINGLTGMGNALQGIQSIGKMFGTGNGGDGNSGGQQTQMPQQFGNQSGDALANYVVSLLNTGKQVR